MIFSSNCSLSKAVAFLREYQPKEHWHISETRAYDTFFCLTHHIKETPDYFLSEFLPKAEQVKSSYKNYWTGIKLERAKKPSPQSGLRGEQDLARAQDLVPDLRILGARENKMSSKPLERKCEKASYTSMSMVLLDQVRAVSWN
jgi:hypothetical protein